MDPIADAVSVTVAKKTGESWGAYESLLYDPLVGKWSKISGHGIPGLVVATASGALTADTTAPALAMPYLIVSAVGGLRSGFQHGRDLSQGGEYTTTVPNTSATFPVSVDKVAGETWAPGANVYRIDATANPNFQKYSTTNLGGLAGTASASAASADTTGYVSVSIAWHPHIATLGSGTTGYSPSITEVGKPSGEIWGLGSIIYTDGANLSAVANPGWREYARSLSGASGSPRGFVSLSFQLQSEHAKFMALGLKDSYVLFPQIATSANLYAWRTTVFPLPADTYRLAYRSYELKPLTGYSTTTKWFPGMCFSFDSSILGAGPNWGISADRVIWHLSGSQVVPVLYTSMVGTPTGQRMPSFPVDDNSAGVSAIHNFRYPGLTAWQPFGNNMAHSTGGGSTSFPYNLPRWNTKVRPALTTLTSVAHLGYASDPVHPGDLTWAGLYSATQSLAGSLYTVTITSTRRSISTVALRADKVTDFTFAVMDPVSRRWLTRYQGGVWQAPFVRLTLPAKTSVTRDATYNDFTGFIHTLQLPVNRSGADVVYTVVIQAVSRGRSATSGGGNIGDIDVKRLSIAIPAT